MKFPRAAGILLHPTSLPTSGGIGDFGPDAFRFIDWLAATGMKIWQVLPLGPTGYGDSPYQCFSAFAGNPLLIHVPEFSGTFPAQHVDFGQVIASKQEALACWLDTVPYDDAVRAFVQREAQWLPDYARFMALKHAHGGVAWTQWEAGARQRDPAAMAKWDASLKTEIERIHKQQYVFFGQYGAIHRACKQRGIQIMGDVPIYVAHDSADVWANPEEFQLFEDGTLRVQAGVPPDYFSETGQLWGNPLYDWQRMHEEGYSWWIARMRAALQMFDVVRLDHFRGFEAYWEIPGDAPTAIEGKWVTGPGAELFDALTKALGPMPIIAENLGLITPEVEQLRERFGYPGMAILQFAFDGQDSDFIPHRYIRESVVYTGTHDNDTTMGWWLSTGEGDSTRSAEAVASEKSFAKRYLATDGQEMNWVLLRTALASVANTVLVPMQDVLGLGSEARMNLPGRQSGNWGFRFTWEQLTPHLTERLKQLAATYER